MKPAARKGDKHTCPKSGHDDGKIIEGASQVLIEGQPAARVGDTIECADGSLQKITEGSSCVFIEGKAAARQGDSSEHGGTINSGAGQVFIGTGGNTRVRIGPGVKIGGKGTVRIGGATIQATTTATQAGEPPTSEAPCDCQAIWKALNTETQAISKEPDDIKRNRQISAAYAKLYQTNKNLRWSGVAALASKQVGCGLREATIMLADIEKRLEVNQVRQSQERDIRNIAMLSFERSQLLLKTSLANTVKNGLAVGNKAVFEEIYPILQFYQRYGLERFKNCAEQHISLQTGSSKEPHELLVKGLEEISKGHINKGTKKILKREQRYTLQKAIYNDWKFARTLEFNQMADKAYIGKFFGTQPIKLSFSADCNGGKEVYFDGINLADYDERWPYAKTVANTFTELESEDPSLINKVIQQIIEQAGP